MPKWQFINVRLCHRPSDCIQFRLRRLSRSHLHFIHFIELTLLIALGSFTLYSEHLELASFELTDFVPLASFLPESLWGSLWFWGETSGSSVGSDALNAEMETKGVNQSCIELPEASIAGTKGWGDSDHRRNHCLWHGREQARCALVKPRSCETLLNLVKPCERLGFETD